MIKVENGVATRESLPSFLLGLKEESLVDLTWTDPALGVQQAAWYPEVDNSTPLNQFERYGEETLTVDTVNKVVNITRAVVPFTQEEITQVTTIETNRIKDLITNQVSERLDAFARTHNYDSILSATTYATSKVPTFAKEGQYCVDVRDSTWSTLYTIMQAVIAGTRPAPTSISDLEADLPELVWPN